MAARSAVLLLVLLALPLALGEYWAFQLGLYFLYAIAALGVALCWGQAGFLPLGQALFVGLAAYLSGAALIHCGQDWWVFLLLPLAALAAGALAFVLGLAIFRGRSESGPYFAIITLAISLLAFQVANSWNQVTGGYNGMKGIPGLPGVEGFDGVYYLAAAALACAVALCAWLVQAPLGTLWRAIALNERRVAYFGYDTALLKAIAFGVSGVLAGIAGALYAPQQGLVTPELVGFALSADLVIWVAVGGRKRVLGPVLGTVLVGILSAELRERSYYWDLIVAALFVFVVLVAPGGIGALLAPLERLLPGRGRTPGLLPAPAGKASRTAVTLAIDGVSAAAGEVRILDGLSLALGRPGIYCLIGPNGAGKTSTFNMLTGELGVQAGEVRLDGAALRRPTPSRLARRGVGRKFQIPSVFGELSIDDNLRIALWSGRSSLLDWLRPATRRWDTPVLAALRERYPFLRDGARAAAALSHGERQVLELSMALVTEPRLLLLDEPCAGLSGEETAEVMAVIRWARDLLGLSVVIIEHDMALVKQLAEHVFVLHQGRLLAEGDVAAIRADPRVREVYVGAAE
ncbi:MAG: ABC transporter permease subunit [Burkholderiales bacterium]